MLSRRVHLLPRPCQMPWSPGAPRLPKPTRSPRALHASSVSSEVAASSVPGPPPRSVPLPCPLRPAPGGAGCELQRASRVHCPPSPPVPGSPKEIRDRCCRTSPALPRPEGRRSGSVSQAVPKDLDPEGSRSRRTAACSTSPGTVPKDFTCMRAGLPTSANRAPRPAAAAPKDARHHDLVSCPCPGGRAASPRGPKLPRVAPAVSPHPKVGSTTSSQSLTWLGRHPWTAPLPEGCDTVSRLVSAS